jgi:hypothetical protein
LLGTGSFAPTATCAILQDSVANAAGCDRFELDNEVLA